MAVILRKLKASGKAMGITYSHYVSVAYIQHATRMRRIVIWGCVWLYHVFPHYPINDKIFVNTLLNIKCVF